jgi:hypothetical protein
MNISDDWKQIILTLPDNYFFELIKNYLGKIETPFNKHALVDRLGNFLIKHRAEDMILGGLTNTEILILTAIEYLPRATAREIYDFFLSDIAYIELCDTLKTLEEKLIIYSVNGSINISPLYIEGLRHKVINPGLLYRSAEIPPTQGQLPWLTEALILGFFSFIFHQRDVVKSTGAFKKKTFNQVDLLFPHSLSGVEENGKLTLIRRVLHNLNLVRIDNSSLIPRKEIWNELIKLPKTDLWLYIIAGATLEGSYGLGGRISTLRRFLESVPKTRAFTSDNLKKIINAIALDEKFPNAHGLNQLIEDLILLNILVPLKDGTICINSIINLGDPNPDYGDINTVILQPNFDITLKPWITLRDGYCISLFSSLKKADLYTEMTLSRESFIKGLTITSSNNFINALKNATGKEIPDNILLSLSEWEESSQKSLHYEASVLILDSDKEFILKETGIIDQYILLNPARGIYLININDYPTVKNLLETVDITPIDKNQSEPIERIDFPTYTPRPPVNIDFTDNGNTPDNQVNTRELELYLRNISATKEEKEDLTSRIKRGIIFTKEQIKPGISRTEFSEARGVNYQGKLRLIEVSLKASNNRLEVDFVKDGEIYRELILPEYIEKSDDKKILHGKKLPTEASFSIDISKISLVRRFQTSLF